MPKRTAAHVLIRRAIFKPRRPQWRKRLPRQGQPNGLRFEYYKSILNFLDDARRMVEQQVVPLLEAFVRERVDAPTDVNKIADQISEEFFKRLRPTEIEGVAQRIAERTSRFQSEQLQKQLRAAFGVDVVHAEPNLGNKIDRFVADNVSLIKSIPNKYLDGVEAAVTRGVRGGKTAAQIAEELRDVYDVGAAKAKFIARDQVGKFFGEVNRARQTALGIKGYTWRTSRDERVRDSHARLEGKHFEWSDPPDVGHPGEDYQCRCYPEPDLSPILEEMP